MKIPVQILNEQREVVFYINLADEESFDSLSLFMSAIGYEVEEIGT